MASPSKGLWWQKFYPVEGDSAVAELWCGEHLWASLHLEGLKLDAIGSVRTKAARETLTLIPPDRPSEFSADGKSWKLDGVAALDQLRAARDWLLENEQGRLPE